MKKDKEKKKDSSMELLILIIFSVYDFGLFLVSLLNRWETGYTVGIAATGLLAIILYVGKYIDYRGRAFVTSALMQSALILYALKTKNISDVMPVFNLMLIMIALYEIKGAVYLTFISFIIIAYINRLIENSMDDKTPQSLLIFFMRIGSLVIVEILVSKWVERAQKTKQKLLETIQELEEAERSKDDFLANVSHEIRTPINSICGMSEIVLHEEDLSKIKEDIYTIQNAGETLASIVSDILDFSELHTGKHEIVSEPYNVTHMLNDAIHTVTAKKGNKNIEIIVNCDTNIPSLLSGDEKKIKRVMNNLLDNAVKFTQEGCIIITISSRKESYGANLLLEIKDTGIGMKEESLEKMFGSFNQVDTRRNRLNSGIGIGIAISQALIHKMGGIISVKSTFGKGSTFKVVIPQKVVDERPIISIQNAQEINVAIYVDMEQFDVATVRDEYGTNIMRMAQQLQVKCHVCRKLAELKRRVEREFFTHIFISLVEYREDQSYFHELSMKTKVIIVIDRSDEKYVLDDRLIIMYKPFYVLPIVSVLQGNQTVEFGRTRNPYECFIAPDVYALVVDDNMTNLKVAQGLLEKYQIKVSTASSGKEALLKIDERRYDLVFMDHMMPEMDGVETLHRIREKVGLYYQRIPVIALTANAVAGMRNMFIAEGFADFVEKPIEITELERALKRNIIEKKIIYVEPDTEQNSALEESYKEKENALEIGDFDTQKGIMYCGGIEKYKEIIKLHHKEAAGNKEQIDELFVQQNWKDYVIAVHGLKSAMMSIGAITLSEKAKQLEIAGKEKNFDYLMSHHGELIQEYEKVIQLLGKLDFVEAEEERTSDAKENSAEQEEREILDDARFREMANAFEEAMYRFMEEPMLTILNSLQKYEYEGHVLQEEIAPIIEKVKSSDYMSASEALWAIRDKYGRKEE